MKKRHIAFVLFSVIFLRSYAQGDALALADKFFTRTAIKEDAYGECVRGVQLAQKDWANGTPKYVFFGYPSPDYTAYLWVLKDKYNLSQSYGGRVETQEGLCYNAYVNEKMMEQKGKDVWVKVAMQADSLNSLGMAEEELWAFIYCHLQLLEDNANAPQVVICCKIDATGALASATVAKSYDATYDAEALRVIRMIPAWVPIPQTLNIPITFDIQLRKGCE